MFCPMTAAPASADPRPYVGTTSEVFNGGQGYFAPHRACWAKFRAVWCTSQMIVENGPHPQSFDPPDSGAWVNPAPVGLGSADGDRMLDFSAGLAGTPRGFNCQNWQEGADDRLSGLAIITNPVVSQGTTFVTLSCDDSRPVACCGGAPQRVFFSTGEFDPPR